MSIIDYFPKGYSPRPIQIEALKELEASWKDNDVFVLNLPVASGKSYLSKTIQNWQKKGAIIVPNNLLVDQYIKDFPNLAKIIGKDRYQCKEHTDWSCKKRGDKYSVKGKARQCEGCPWLADNKRIRSPYLTKYITNNFLYAQMQKHTGLLIADEAHNLVDFLQDWYAVRISHSQYKYPRLGGYIDRDVLLTWLKSLVNIEKIIKFPERGQKGLQVLYNELTSDYPRFLIKEEQELKKDSQGNQWYEIFLKLCPVDIRDMPALFWPRSVTKIVLMSATINEKDIEELGLQNKKIKYINADSCIPADRRPVTFIKTSTVSGTNLNQSIPLVTERVIELADKNRETKGLIHATYNQAALLKNLLPKERFLYHTRSNKKQVYEKFRATDEPVILVASGLYEGIDLPEDSGRWQVLAKVPFPNLGEPAIKYRMAKDKDWYSWAATKVVLQACGRICRGPTDYGETYIIDDSFKRLYQDNPNQYPRWFQDSVKGITK